MSSNLTIFSNLMPDDDPRYKPEYRYIPGDYVGKIYPTAVDNRSIQQYLSQQQIVEFDQYLVCTKCGNTCAGTCQK